MTVFFENSYGKSRAIGDCRTIDDVHAIIKEFLDDHNFKSYYTRVWEEDDKIWFDVGSHSEFFYIIKDN